jgi:Domain of unknown function (DUF4157)
VHTTLAAKQRFTPEMARSVAVPRFVNDVLRAPGRPLGGGTRVAMEHQLGHDFSRVRVHTGERATAAAGAVNAAAFAVGDDIVFGERRYLPETTAGRQLIAHELAHVAQQRGSSAHDPLAVAPAGGVLEREADAAAQGVSRGGGGRMQVAARGARALQRQPTEPSKPAITARTILPFQQRRQIQIDQILDAEMAKLIGGVDPVTAKLLETLRGQRATITTSTDDLVEADFNQRELTLPGLGTFRDVKLSLSRNPAGTLTFEITGMTGEPSVRAPIFTRADLTASSGDGGYVLSSGTGASAVREIGIRPSKEGVDLRVFTDSFKDQLPKFARGLLPGHLDVLRLTELPAAEAGTEAVQRAASDATRSAAAKRGAPRPRQQIEVGAGLTSFSDPGLVFRTSWQYTFQPLPAAGSLLGVPLQVAIQYAPGSEVLGRIASGGSTSLSALKVPINLRVMAGVAAGTTLGGEGGRPGVPVAGPTIGVGIGADLGRWRVQLDYDHLFNLVNHAEYSGASSVVLGGGIAF